MKNLDSLTRLLGTLSPRRGMRTAFTLAEVLVTLTILGILASIIVPNVVQRYQDRQTVTQLKKAYKIIDEAVSIAIVENGPLDTWAWPVPDGYYDGKNSEYFVSFMAPYFDYIKICKPSNKGCFSYGWKDVNTHSEKEMGYYKSLNKNFLYNNNGPTEYSSRGFILKNGMRIKFTSGILPNGWNNTGIFISATVDLNGSKLPNQYGYDVFSFDIVKDGVLLKRKDWQANSSKNCNKETTDDYSGTSCSTWVMKHGNLDYKYRDVSAEW